MTNREFARMVDIVQLSPATTLGMVDALIEDACAGPFYSLGCPYCYHPYVIQKLRERGMEGTVRLLGGGGFPDGNWPTPVKLASVSRCLEVGCGEIDLTTNLGWIKSRMWEQYKSELEQTRQLARDVVLKVIIHSPQLTEEEIRTVCAIALEIGADYIKTDTGRSPNPTTPEQVRLIRECIGGRAKIKASGGVRGVESVLAMQSAGADRLGMGQASAMEVFRALPQQND